MFEKSIFYVVATLASLFFCGSSSFLQVTRITTISQIMTNPPTLKIGDETIEISSNEKLLGINIDNVLSWSTQIENTIKKCNTTGVIQLIPPVLSSETLLHILLSSEYSGFRPSTTAVVTQTVHT